MLVSWKSGANIQNDLTAISRRPVKPNSWLGCGALLAGLAVALGAFGAHGLEDRLEARYQMTPRPEAGQNTADPVARGLKNYQTAAQYQMYHGLALLGVGFAGWHGRSRWLCVAGWSFVTGVALFCGCLYALVFGAPKGLGAVVPIGGVAFIVGWVALALAAFRMPPLSNPGA